MRLSVFAGGWNLAAAEGVCAGEELEDWEVLDVLTALVDKSLVVYAEMGGVGRYRLLETVRQYASERLMESGCKAGVQQRHRDFFVVLSDARQALGDDAFAAAWSEGRAMTPEQVAESALREGEID